MSLKLSSRQSGDVSILDFAGSITLGQGSSVLRDALSDSIARNRRKILLNLAEVSYVDSSGLRELVSAFNALSKDGGQLKLLNPTPRTRDLLRITKLHSVFEIHDDEAAAVSSFV